MQDEAVGAHPRYASPPVRPLVLLPRVLLTLLDKAAEKPALLLIPAASVHQAEPRVARHQEETNLCAHKRGDGSSDYGQPTLHSLGYDVCALPYQKQDKVRVPSIVVM